MERPVPTYAKAAETPEWWNLRVRNAAGEELRNVVEVDTAAGWAVVVDKDAQHHRQFLRIEGRFSLEWMGG